MADQSSLSLHFRAASPLNSQGKPILTILSDAVPHSCALSHGSFVSAASSDRQADNVLSPHLVYGIHVLS